MNKSELKNFAIGARVELLRRVADRAKLYGIDEDRCKGKNLAPSASFQKIDGQLLTGQEIAQRNALLAQISVKGYRQVMEEAAYTWFNRFIALCFMQEHNRLPVPMTVLPEAPGALPAIVREAQDLDLPGVDMGEVLAMLDSNRTDELYKYLLIVLCNALSEPLPQMFEHISDYTELLFPDGLLKADSVLGELAKLDGDSWREIQVIGWLYQYYNTQLKDETFELLKKNVKITKERIGAATQLFTPEWIVRYMVENSLGRLWQEGHHDENLRMKWRYYMDEAQQEPMVAAQLAEKRKGLAALQPEQIRLLDPCMGSGHILVYAFDVLMDIYRSMGYTDRDAVQSIVGNNLYGLDIDDRAAQLAYFAVMMKACEYDRRFLRRGVQPHVCAIAESAKIEDAVLNRFGAEKALAKRLLDDFRDAKEYGSILHVDLMEAELDRLAQRTAELKTAEGATLTDMADRASAAAAIEPLLEQTRILARMYDVVVTNPPYMGSSGMNEKLSRLVKEEYPDSKSDLSTVFMEQCLNLCAKDGYMAMINIPVWMFLSSYEKLRTNMIQHNTFINMVHLGRGIFGSDFGTTTFVIAKDYIQNFKGSYRRLFNKQGAVDSIEQKEKWFFEGMGSYTAQQENFKKIPGMPVAYWVSEATTSLFDSNPKYGELFDACHGLLTGHDDGYIFLWFEVAHRDILICGSAINQLKEANKRYIPLCKGGEFRKWYGNLSLIVRYDDDGIAGMSQYPKYASNGLQYYMKEGVTWTEITMASLAARYLPQGCIFSLKGPSTFPHSTNVYKVLGFLCSKVANYFTNIINPTVSTGSGVIKKIPVVEIEKWDYALVKKCVNISSNDWDSFETSWGFKKHPLI